MRSVWLVLLLLGCPYPREMKQGAASAARGEYRAALERYDRALQARPRSEAALAARAATIDGAVAEALAQANRALQGAAYEDTLGQLAYVAELRPDHPELVGLRTRVGDGLLAETRASLDAQAWAEAYGRAVRANRLVPERIEIAPILDQLRGNWFAWAEQSAVSGDWRNALALLNDVATWEPDRASEVDTRARDIRGRWAAVVAADAEAREREALLGPALALRARAVEIAGRTEDRDAVDRLRSVLRQQGQLAVELHWNGPSERTDVLVGAVQADLAQLSGLVWAPGGVVADLRAPPGSCTQGSTSWVAEQPYIAGQRQVPNPDWATIDQQLRDARARTAQAEGLVLEARARGERAAWELEQAEQQVVAPLAAQREALRAEQENAAAHVEGATRMVAEIEAQLAQLQASGADDLVIAGTIMTLGGTRERLQQEQNRLQAARAGLADLVARYDVAMAQIQPLRDTAAALRETHRGQAQALADWQQQVNTLDAQLAATAPILFEDVSAVFRYDVVRWQRKCAAELGVTTRVPGMEARALSWVEAAETWDDAHPAWPQYGVGEDPAWYPQSDADLVRSVDLRLAPAASAIVRSVVIDAFAMRVADARQAFVDRPDRGSALLLGLLLAAPYAVDDDTRGRLEAHLSRQYELESPGSLTQ